MSTGAVGALRERRALAERRRLTAGRDARPRARTAVPRGLACLRPRTISRAETGCKGPRPASRSRPHLPRQSNRPRAGRGASSPGKCTDLATRPRPARVERRAAHPRGRAARPDRRRPGRPRPAECRGRAWRGHPFTSERFHVLLNSLFKVLFNFPSRYLFAIGLSPVFSLRWSSPPALGCIIKQPDSGDAPRPRGRRARKGLTPALGRGPCPEDFGVRPRD